MELVRGVPITEFCDQDRLTVRERLELFIAVCQAIQHAHQKGDHPSRHQAVQHPGRRCTTATPVPKVIDFGIAKAIGRSAYRQDAVHRLRADHRHAGLHEPRAGGDERPGRRHPQRHLFARRAALRTAHRHNSPQPRNGQACCGDELLRLIREREAPTPSRISCLGLTLRNRGKPPDGTEEAGPPREGRPRLDRQRHWRRSDTGATRRQWTGGGRRAVPESRAGKGGSTLGSVREFASWP